MSVIFESVRFGTVEVADSDVIEFPDGLVGLPGLRYTLLDRNPGTGFLWLHCVDDPALALPVVGPGQFFEDFRFEVSDEDRERIGLEDLSAGQVLVTVRATPDPMDITANLRAPLLIHERRGFQLINLAEDSPLQAPLFVLAESSGAERSNAADAA